VSDKIKNEAMKEVKHMQSKSEGTKDMKQMQRSKGKGWDGKSRPVTDKYRNRWEEIFGKKEDEELKKSYEQSKRNREEREDNEEYLKEIKNKL
tara:strand:+ start:416 stop:694 length:279 start_codon:yes stop_codon:yes gene_type:complete